MFNEQESYLAEVHQQNYLGKRKSFSSYYFNISLAFLTECLSHGK